MKLLVTDDDEIQIEHIRSILEETEHQADFFNNAHKALAHFELHSKDYDLILSDILMPGMDGLEYIRLLRRVSPGIKIIAISAGGQLEPDFYLKLAQDFGATVLLEKPIRKVELVEALTKIQKSL